MNKVACQALVDALNGNYKGTYSSFEKEIIKFVEDYMKTVSNMPDYNPTCMVSETLKADGVTRGTDKIIFKKDIIKSLKKGKKLYLIVIFHELSHIHQNIQIKNEISTPNILRYIKDILLNEYQNEKNKKYHMPDIYNIFNFYMINYKNESSEIDANLNAILLTINFFLKNNIDYEDEKKYLNNYFEKLIKRKFKKRNLTYGPIFNSYHLTLEEAFDCAIKEHSEWLERYKQLNVEYELNNGLVQKKTKVIYQKYDKNSDIYIIRINT